MEEDYTWVFPKQNEQFRSHDFWLKLWIQYTTTYDVMGYPKNKNYERKSEGGIDYDVTRTKFLKTVSTALDKYFWNYFNVFVSKSLSFISKCLTTYP